ncbi:hypothetical protein KKF70_00255 [bacterium]|nr:hypothetical protein [bacterium]MBU3930719.1 hypothetical protein [bacterium]
MKKYLILRGFQNNKIKNILIALFFFILAIPLSAEKNKKTDEYTEKTIIKGEWGNLKTQFGFYRQPSGYDYPDMGPNAIAVGKNGDIYILDPVNDRIVIYNDKGGYKSTVSIAALKRYKTYDPWLNYLAVDLSGYIYILTKHLDFVNDSVVVKINRKGEIVHQYTTTLKLKESFNSKSKKYAEELKIIEKQPNMEIVSEEVGNFMGFFIDSKDDVYIQAEDAHLINISKTKSHKIYIKGGKPAKNLKHLFIRKPLTPIKKYLPKKPQAIANLVLKDENGKVLKNIDLDLIKKQLPEGVQIFDVRYENEDIFGNIYFLALIENQSDRCFIIKYDKNWEISAIIKIKDISSYPFAISGAGNIYQLIWDSKKLKDGVKILSWQEK